MSTSLPSSSPKTAQPPVPAACQAAGGRVFPRVSSATWRGASGIVGVFVLWELLTRLLDVPAYVLPTVSSILLATVQQYQTLALAAGTTFMEAVVGFCLGTLAGLLLAIVLTMLPRARKPVLPLVTALNSVPVVAYAPLILLWFGIGPQSKIIMVSLSVGFTVFLHALAGLGNIDQRIVDLMRSFGSSSAAILWRIRLPAAMPLTAAGMRVSTVRAMIVAIVTEMLGAYHGLGWTIYQAVLQVDFVQVWSAIFVASAGSLLFFGAVSFVERRYVFWK